MKKLIALALAVLMLMSACAFAEEPAAEAPAQASITLVTDPQMTITSSGETQSVDMTGLTLQFASQLVDDAPTFECDVFNGDETLMAAVAQILDTRLVYTVDGAQNAYAIDLASMGLNDDVLAMLKQSFGASAAELPAFQGLAIPRVPMVDTVAGMMGTEPAADADGNPSASFELPYEQTNQFLQMALYYAQSMGLKDNPSTAQVIDFVNQMIEAGAGIALSGTVTDAADSSTALVEFTLVEDGVAQDAPSFALQAVSAENDFYLGLLANAGAEYQTMGYIEAVSDPAAPRFDIFVNIYDAYKIQMGIYGQNDLQVVYLQADMGYDGSANVQFTYGKENDMDVRQFDFALNETYQTIEFGARTDTVADAEGNREGTLQVHFKQDDNAVDIVANLLSGKNEFDFLALPASVIEIDTNDSAAVQQMQQDLSSGLMGVMMYFQGLADEMAA